MSITLTYPIRETYENLALKKDRTVVAYYRIPNTPITITDEEKKGKHKITVDLTQTKSRGDGERLGL